MIFVSKKSKASTRVGLKEIAKETNSPEHFMGKIMQTLSKRKLVYSAKGPNGGFYIDNKLYKTSLLDIVFAIDGDNLKKDCVLGLKACSEKCPCPVHDEYKDIKLNLLNMLETNTLGQFNEKLDSGKFFLK